VGARFGQCLAESNGRKVTQAPGGGIDVTPFSNLRPAKIKLVRKGNQVSVSLNDRSRGTVTTTSGDGRWGFMLTGMHKAFLNLSVAGVPDLPAEKH
jgi:hypothetical protein